jgi:hypothetical protein
VKAPDPVEEASEVVEFEEVVTEEDEVRRAEGPRGGRGKPRRRARD